jgi:23S rRNA (uridine2552-2'-O)-methyltransferase
VNFNPKDHFFKKAKKDNFVARSVYKLEEIDQQYKLFRSGQVVLDLGCAPGSWSQIASQKIGPSGRLIGIDLSPVKVKLPNATFFELNVLEMDWSQFLQDIKVEKFDLVISDMAPKTTGIKSTDQARSAELCQMAFDLALKLLKTNGHFVCKLFHSDDFAKIKDQIKDNFKRFEAMKPDSTRSQSKEIFLIGMQRR